MTPHDNAPIKQNYIKPMSEEFHLEADQLIAMSGYADDSDDFEFEATAKRRGEWGDLWKE